MGVQRLPHAHASDNQEWKGHWLKHAQQLTPGKPWPPPYPDGDLGQEPYQALTTRSYLNGAPGTKGLLLSLPAKQPSQQWLPGRLPLQQAGLAVNQHQTVKQELVGYGRAHLRTVSRALGLKPHHLLDSWAGDASSQDKTAGAASRVPAAQSRRNVEQAGASPYSTAARDGCGCSPCWLRGNARSSASQHLQDTSVLMDNEDYRRALLAGDVDALLDISSQLLRGQRLQPRPSQVLASLRRRHSYAGGASTSTSHVSHVPKYAVKAAVQSRLRRHVLKHSSVHPDTALINNMLNGFSSSDSCEVTHRRRRQQPAAPLWPDLRGASRGARLMLAPWADSTTTEQDQTSGLGFKDIIRRARVRNLQRDMQPYMAWARVLDKNHKLQKQNEFEQMAMKQARYNLEHALLVQQTSPGALVASRAWHALRARRQQAAQFTPVAGVRPQYYDGASSCTPAGRSALKAAKLPWKQLRQYLPHSSGSESSDDAAVWGRYKRVAQQLNIGGCTINHGFTQRVDRLLADRARARKQPKLRRPRPSSSEDGLLSYRLG